jgi:hypothetical protein
LKLDTHGFEVSILRGAAQIESESSRLVIESYNFDLAPECLRFPQFCAYLEGPGFRCIDICDVVHRPGDGWLWARFTVHYTSKHGSWLNQVESEISLFSRQCLGKRRIEDIITLSRQTKAWNRRVNRGHITIRWKFTRKQARREMNYSFTRSRY